MESERSLPGFNQNSNDNLNFREPLKTLIFYCPTGIAEMFFLKVGMFFFQADFVVVDYIADPRVSLILGRPFLRTARALIDVHDEQMTLRHEESIPMTSKVGDTNTHLYNSIENDKMSTKGVNTPHLVLNGKNATSWSREGYSPPGHKILKSGIEVDKAKLMSVHNCPHPTTLRSKNLPPAYYLLRRENPYHSSSRKEKLRKHFSRDTWDGYLRGDDNAPRLPTLQIPCGEILCQGKSCPKKRRRSCLRGTEALTFLKAFIVTVDLRGPYGANYTAKKVLDSGFYSAPTIYKDAHMTFVTQWTCQRARAKFR
ncbi:reverse transcriptase domain-containing protein [Tanacetum coccineum]